MDGGNIEERLTTSDNNQTPGSFSPNDGQLIFSEINLATGADLWVLTLDSGRKLSEFRRVPSSDNGATISRDGRWLAYTSDQSGQPEIYVLPFPGPGGKNFQISTDGGSEPVWSRDGSHLYYRNGDKMMAVDITTQPDFKATSPRFLFVGQYEFTDTGRSGYDVAEDGRFLMVQPVEPEQPATQINLVLHWFEELKHLASGN
jgi:Tol biopolymer transport system component